MGREIKFRVWEIAGNQFWDDSLGDWKIELLSGNEPKLIVLEETFSPYGEQEFYWREIENVVFQQYTGLKDKNGQKIYEGDVLKVPCDIEDSIHGQYSFKEVVYRNGTWIVQYIKSETGFKLPRGYTAGLLIDHYDHDMKSLVFKDDWLESTEIEVKGNIYENPELLEDKSDE